jgi:hypothetical protein
LRQGSKNIASGYWRAREMKAANLIGNDQKIFTLKLALGAHWSDSAALPKKIIRAKL